jgi:hypothetical protein
MGLNIKGLPTDFADERKKLKSAKLRFAKTACYEARDVVLVAFYEDEIREFPVV